MDRDQEELFQSIILDHDERPRNFLRMDDATHVQSGLNPLCGDRFTVFLDVEGKRIKRASFYGRGCTLSKASASMMADKLTGRTIGEARSIRNDLQEMLTSTQPPNREVMGELEALIGVRDHPSRMACVMLAWDAMLAAIE